MTAISLRVAFAITAWNFAVSSPNPNGGIHRETHSADVYLSEVTRGLPRAPNHLDWLRPGESRTIAVDAAPPGASVEILAVVFDDATAWGDPKTVQSFFDQRALERDELGKVVATFDAVLPAQKGVAALEELQRRLAASTAGQESPPHRSAREAVVPDTAKLEQMIARYAPTDIGADLSQLSSADRRVLGKLVDASKIIDAL